MKPTALTTLENAKAALKVKGSTDDALLTQLIERASAWIESQTGRKFKARRYNGTTTPSASAIHPTTSVEDEDYLYFSGYTLDEGGDTIEGGSAYQLPQFPVQANSVLAFALASLSDRA